MEINKAAERSGRFYQKIIFISMPKKTHLSDEVLAITYEPMLDYYSKVSPQLNEPLITRPV
jgi:hypothetical protein